MATITVEARLAGQRRPLFEDWQVSLPPGVDAAGGGCTLRDLVATIVRAEVGAFRERREQHRLTRVLAREEIAAAAERGKIDMGGRTHTEPDVDPDVAIETALQAYQDGLYYVFLDDEQVGSLDSRLRLLPESRVMFLRLVALAGG